MIMAKKAWIEGQCQEAACSIPQKEQQLEASRLIEPRYEKAAFCICENKDADQLRGNREANQRLSQISFAVTAKLISAFVFATRILLSLFYLNPEFQVSSHLL